MVILTPANQLTLCRILLIPAFVMDVMTGYYNTMVLFFIMGSFFGTISGERQLLNLGRMRTWRRALLSERQR